MGDPRQAYAARIHRVTDHIDSHLAQPLDLAVLASVANFSAWHFHRVFQAVTGETLADPSPGSGLIRLYGISDNGFDLLGGYRGPTPMPPELRGRATWRHQQEILEGLNFQGQVSLLSDQNFLEQYYKNEFDLGPNQETFAYFTWGRKNYGASLLVEDRVGRNWITETSWLPRVDGHLTGQTFLNDLFVYSARGSAAYAQLRPSEYNPFPLLATDKRTDTGRFDIWQELSVPLSLGPVKFAPSP